METQKHFGYWLKKRHIVTFITSKVLSILTLPTASKQTLKTILRQLTPNASAILLVALMLLVYQVIAAPDTVPANPNAAPRVVSYQGMLTDAADKPINDDVEMVISAYSQPTGGTALWVEAHTGNNAVPVKEGLFNIMLGSLTPIPLDLPDNSELYLGIQVGNDAEMTPRERISSVFSVINGGNSTIPDDSITTAKLANGAVTSAKISDGAVSSTQIADGSIGITDMAPGIFPVYNTTSTSNEWQLPSCGGSFDVDGSYHTVPGLSISVDGPGTFIVDFTGMGRNNTASRAIYSTIFVDGVRTTTSSGTLLGGCRNSSGDSGYVWCTLANGRSATLGAGTHTIDVRAYCDAGTGYVHGGWLRVMRLP